MTCLSTLFNPGGVCVYLLYIRERKRIEMEVEIVVYQCVFISMCAYVCLCTYIKEHTWVHWKIQKYVVCYCMRIMDCVKPFSYLEKMTEHMKYTGCHQMYHGQTPKLDKSLGPRNQIYIRRQRDNCSMACTHCTKRKTGVEVGVLQQPQGASLYPTPVFGVRQERLPGGRYVFTKIVQW